MHATIDPSRPDRGRPDPSRSGAVWVTATGAFLLLAAAAVFTAVRWDQIPDAAKLAALVAATGACLVAGRSMRERLPASAGALTHLGAFLVPVDVAAVGLRMDLGWPGMVLAQGAAATVTFGLVALSLRSKVLGWAFVAAAAVLAGGVGAVTAVPAPVVLVGLAVGATVTGHGRVASTWALLVGLVPLLIGLSDQATADVLAQMGLRDLPLPVSLATALVAAVVVGAEGRRTDDTGLAMIGVGVGVLGAASTWSRLDVGPGADLVAGAGTFLAIQIVAHRLRHDAFWGGPARVVAGVAEVVTAVGTAMAAGALVVVAVFSQEPAADVALAAAVTAAGWLLVELRTDGRGRRLATWGAAVAVVTAAGFATMSGPWVAVTTVLVAVAALATPVIGRPWADAGRRPGAVAVATLGSWAAPVLAGAPWLAMATGALGAAAITDAGVRRFRISPDADARTRNEAEAWGWFLATSALVPASFGVAVAAEDLSGPGLVAGLLVAAAVLGHGLAALADRAGATPLSLGTAGRIGGASVLVGAIGLPPALIGVVALAVTALAAGDAVRLRQPLAGLGASVALPAAVAAFGHAAGLSLAHSGLATTVSAAVAWGLGCYLGRAARVPVAATVAVAIGLGLALASTDTVVLGEALVVTGGLSMAAAVMAGRLDGLLAGAVVTTAGIWLRLAEAGVEISEPYLAPVGLILLGAGVRARSRGAGSWVAYGPLVGLVGGSPLAERLAGGSGWHAVLAGAVAVVAVVAGGQRRLIAPLVLGTGLLVALVGYETLAITRTLPTWTWLALGGATLFAAGVAMERRDMGPLESGRRIVDVVSERYQ